MDVVGQVVSDWTVPQVMILVMVLPEPSMASLEATIRADEEAKHRRDLPGKTLADRLIFNQLAAASALAPISCVLSQNHATRACSIFALPVKSRSQKRMSVKAAYG